MIHVGPADDPKPQETYVPVRIVIYCPDCVAVDFRPRKDAHTAPVQVLCGHHIGRRL